MPLRAPSVAQSLGLPPAYRLVALRESGDAFAKACAIAREAGAGTLVWVRRFDVAEFAVVLEPEEPLKIARRAFHVGMNALADALAAHAPPERPIEFDWPDAILVDGALVGGGRLGWPKRAGEDEIPDWLVFAASVRTAIMRAGEPGLRPLLGALDELGFEGIDAGEILASFARYLMAGMHDLKEEGFAAAERRWLRRMRGRDRPAAQQRSANSSSQGESDLRAALAEPSWRDPETGMPWL